MAIPQYANQYDFKNNPKPHASRKFCRFGLSNSSSSAFGLTGALREFHPCRKLSVATWHALTKLVASNRLELMSAYEKVNLQKLEGLRVSTTTSNP